MSKLRIGWLGSTPVLLLAGSPTRHQFLGLRAHQGSNLWPIYLLFCSPVVAIYLLGILLFRRRA